MRIDLLDLLADREIVHPTRISAVTWAGSELVLSLTGYRWWEQACTDRRADGAIRFVFGGVADGTLRPSIMDDDDEALEDFAIRPITDVPWAQPADWSIYCSAALPDPMAIYVGLHDFLAREGAFYTPADFLNGAAEISRFTAITQTPGFMLGSGPECVRALLCAELERQGVRFSVVHTMRDVDSRLLVRLGGSSFVCDTAVAEFEAAAG